jgi:hypothetical protein
VIKVIVVAECGSKLSQIWTASNGIPKGDLEGSGEVSAMCSTPRSGHGTRVPTDTSVDFDAEALQFAVQRRTGDTESCCGLHTVPAGLTQSQDDRVSLD